MTSFGIKKRHITNVAFKICSIYSELDGIRNGARLEPKKIAKAPEGEGCPRCGGYVYAAEQMLARGRVSFSF